MEIIMLEDGLTARNTSGFEVYEINGLVIQRRDYNDFYEVTDGFFKVSCPSGTRHIAELLENGKINLF